MADIETIKGSIENKRKYYYNARSIIGKVNKLRDDKIVDEEAEGIFSTNN